MYRSAQSCIRTRLRSNRSDTRHTGCASTLSRTTWAQRGLGDFARGGWNTRRTSPAEAGPEAVRCGGTAAITQSPKQGGQGAAGQCDGPPPMGARAARPPPPPSVRASPSISMARPDSGTLCGRWAFMRSPGRSPGGLQVHSHVQSPRDRFRLGVPADGPSEASPERHAVSTMTLEGEPCHAGRARRRRIRGRASTSSRPRPPSETIGSHVVCRVPRSCCAFPQIRKWGDSGG